MIDTYDQVAGERRPSFISGRVVGVAPEAIAYEGAVLPILGRDGANVWLLIGTFFNN